MEFYPVIRACGNGLSQMLSSVSASITGILCNRQLMYYAGEDGVAGEALGIAVSLFFMITKKKQYKY